MKVTIDTATSSRAFLSGLFCAWTSVFCPVISGTYVGIGALAHDYGFSSWWLALSTVLVWAAPAQVILVSSLATGAAMIEIVVAVSLSSIRLFPMVVALLPLIRRGASLRDLLLPAHFTSISMWVESLRLLPIVPQERRIAFTNGLAVGFMAAAVAAGFVGFYLAAGLPPLLAGMLLFLTPMSFLMSTARNSRMLIDRVAFVLGLVLGPVLAWYQIELDLLWTGVIGGMIAFGALRLREAMR